MESRNCEAAPGQPPPAAPRQSPIEGPCGAHSFSEVGIVYQAGQAGQAQLQSPSSQKSEAAWICSTWICSMVVGLLLQVTGEQALPEEWALLSSRVTHYFCTLSDPISATLKLRSESVSSLPEALKILHLWLSAGCEKLQGGVSYGLITVAVAVLRDSWDKSGCRETHYRDL